MTCVYVIFKKVCKRIRVYKYSKSMAHKEYLENRA